MWEAKWFGVPAIHAFAWGDFTGHWAVSLWPGDTIISCVVFFLLSVIFLKMQDSFAGHQDKVMHQVTWDVVSGWVKLQNFLETAAGMGKKQRA